MNEMGIEEVKNVLSEAVSPEGHTCSITYR